MKAVCWNWLHIKFVLLAKYVLKGKISYDILWMIDRTMLNCPGRRVVNLLFSLLILNCADALGPKRRETVASIFCFNIKDKSDKITFNRQ